MSSPYRGRIAPSPTGYLHLGHARTFLIASDRARQAGGNLIFRNEDLDPDRCRPEFVSAMYEDLRWLGLSWSEGPDCGGPYPPYSQGERRDLYLKTWRQLRDGGFLYPCTCSRRELALSATAPNENDDEPIYPGKCRSRNDACHYATPQGVNWRFRVPDGQEIAFSDLHLGPQISRGELTLGILSSGAETTFPPISLPVLPTTTPCGSRRWYAEPISSSPPRGSFSSIELWAGKLRGSIIAIW